MSGTMERALTHQQASCGHCIHASLSMRAQRRGARGSQLQGKATRSASEQKGICVAPSAKAQPQASAQQDIRLHASFGAVSACGLLLGLLVTDGAQAAAEVPLTPGVADIFESWLGAVSALGPWGPVAFIVTISLVECIPLFPTQPFTIGAGLLFGAPGGAACNLVGLCIAASLAFTFSKTVGGGTAKKIVEEETKGKGNALQHQLANVTKAIESGSRTQQFAALVALRLTPIVPFSASNYVLGLSPLSYPSFIAGTAAGMTVWSSIFASLGAGARGLLTSGMDIGEAINEVSQDAGDITEKVLIAAAIFGAGVFAYKKVMSGAPEAEEEVAASSKQGQQLDVGSRKEGELEVGAGRSKK